MLCHALCCYAAPPAFAIKLLPKLSVYDGVGLDETEEG